MEQCIWKLPPGETDIVRSKVTFILKRHNCIECNLRPWELKAIKELRSLSDILFIKADKGNMTVIMKKQDYDEKWCCDLDVEIMPSSQHSHKGRATGVVRCKKEGMLLQPIQWCCVGCVIHHEWDVHEEQKIYAWREQAIIREIVAHDLYCCLLPWCEALRICRSGFPIATVLSWSFDRR